MSRLGDCSLALIGVSLRGWYVNLKVSTAVHDQLRSPLPQVLNSVHI